MSYAWHIYDRDTGELFTVVEEDEPCICLGEDIPHPKWHPSCTIEFTLKELD